VMALAGLAGAVLLIIGREASIEYVIAGFFPAGFTHYDWKRTRNYVTRKRTNVPRRP
jgi:hypothetical protein